MVNKTLSDLLAEVEESVVTVELFTSEGGQTKLSVRGTGFFIKEGGLIATCAHVWNQIPPEERSNLKSSVYKESKGKLNLYEKIEAELVTKDDGLDIAILKIKDSGRRYKPLEVGDSDSLKAGDEVVSIGFPLATEIISHQLGLTLMANKCIVGNVKPNEKGQVLAFLLNTYAAPGSSGSPLFSLNDGKVVGWMAKNLDKTFNNINQETKEIRVPQMISIALPINNLIRFLKANKLNP